MATHQDSTECEPGGPGYSQSCLVDSLAYFRRALQSESELSVGLDRSKAETHRPRVGNRQAITKHGPSQREMDVRLLWG